MDTVIPFPRARKSLLPIVANITEIVQPSDNSELFLKQSMDQLYSSVAYNIQPPAPQNIDAVEVLRHCDQELTKKAANLFGTKSYYDCSGFYQIFEQEARKINPDFTIKAIL